MGTDYHGYVGPALKCSYTPEIKTGCGHCGKAHSKNFCPDCGMRSETFEFGCPDPEEILPGKSKLYRVIRAWDDGGGGVHWLMNSDEYGIYFYSEDGSQFMREISEDPRVECGAFRDALQAEIVLLKQIYDSVEVVYGAFAWWS